MGLVTENVYGYTIHKKHVTGRGFIDTFRNLTSSVGSYMVNNKDLIAKPLLSAVGSLGALGLTTGVPAIINHIMKQNRNLTKTPQTPKIPDDPKYKEILDSLMTAQASAAQAQQMQQPQTSTPVTNLIGSGKRGRGIKLGTQ